MADLRWWPRFRLWLVSAVERGDWPDSEEFWTELERNVARSGPAEDVSLESCQEAARRLMRQGFPFPSDLHRDLPNALQDVFRAASMPDGPASGSREEAIRLSAGCDCGGAGLTSAMAPAPERFQSHPVYARGVSVAIYCPRLCAMSRWLVASHQGGEGDLYKRFALGARQAASMAFTPNAATIQSSSAPEGRTGDSGGLEAAAF